MPCPPIPTAIALYLSLGFRLRRLHPGDPGGWLPQRIDNRAYCIDERDNWYMTYKYGQTAVIVPVPAAEPAVWSWRTRFDSSAHFGVPAHITVVFPFLLQDQLGDQDLADLRAIFAAERSFTSTFASLKTFTGGPGGQDVLYLEPDPPAPFLRLTARLTARWPDAPPYGGTIRHPIPHLTVTELASGEAIEQARAGVGRHLPITTGLDRGCVLAFDGTQWREQASLPFGPAAG